MGLQYEAQCDVANNVFKNIHMEYGIIYNNELPRAVSHSIFQCGQKYSEKLQFSKNFYIGSKSGSIILSKGLDDSKGCIENERKE